MEMAASSNVYEETEWKYKVASAVNVSSVVLVKLSGHSSYPLWKAQLLSLIENQELLHIIYAEYPSSKNNGVHMIEQFDKLVKGWILSTVGERLLLLLAYVDTAREVWMKLESIFNPPKSYTSEEEDDNDDTEGGGDDIKKKQEGKYLKALLIHVSDYVTVKLSQSDNYEIWKYQMLCLLKRKKLLHIIDDEYPFPEDKGIHMISKYNKVVKSWIFTTMDKQLLEDFKDYYLAQFIWIALNKKFYEFTSFKNKDLARKLLEKFPDAAMKNGDILKAITISFPTDLGFVESVIYPSFHNVLQHTISRGSLLFHYNFLDKCVEDILQVVKICNSMWCIWLGKNSMILFVPIAALYSMYQWIYFLILVLRLPFSMLYFLLWKVFAFNVDPFKNIEKKKTEYKEAKKTVSLICDQMGTNNEGYRESIIEAVLQDSSGNYLVHLVGRLAPSFVLDRTTGAALQLQRELIWREEVQKLVLPLLLLEENNLKETPAMVFTREHQNLIKQGEAWMKTTAESCSITAALIVTIAFAAAITVPGGSNQESGIPVFKKESAFTIFAVFNAVSLFTATTALLLFLSILTARFSERDFLVSLPRRLIFGLLMLFLSTTTMIVAFCAILFLVFCDQRPWMLAPICVLACLPISVIVTIKLPLLVDLIRSTYVPIFGKQSYLESCKINRGNTVFMKYGCI